MPEKGRKQPIYEYWLANIPGMGSRTIEKLLLGGAAPEEIYRMTEKELTRLFQKQQVGEQKLQALLKQRGKWEPEAEYECLTGKGIRFLSEGEAGYPNRLRTIPDRPYGLYVKGELPEEEKLTVAMIGARNGSAYGRYVAEEFGRQLAQAGVEIVSGMARGIDGISQQAALEAGGKSYGVLGCGVDICYPKENHRLYEKLQHQGGLISAYPPGTLPSACHFPPRNRIISGLSDGVLVIEAKEKSGTLITVDMALEQGKEVFVVPGRITDRLSDGCNRLMEQGAAVALSPMHLLQAMRETVHRSRGSIPVGKKDKLTTEINLTEQEKEVLALLDFYPVSLSRLRERMLTKTKLKNLTLPETMGVLMQLTVKGYVKNEGNYYALCKPIRTTIS